MIRSVTPREIAQKIVSYGLTQSEAAERAGFSQATFSRVLDGTHEDPRSSTTKKLEALLLELKKASDE